MRILWFTWKDSEHPLAGGAEIVHDELATRLANEGHEVVFIVPRFKGSASESIRNGYKVVRVGSSATVYWEAYKLYKKQYKGWADLVIESYFVLPFLTKLYVKEKKVLFVHNLCRQIWWYQMFFPASVVGYVLEPLYLRLINNQKAITISESTKRDMVRYGFAPENISIISEGIEISPIKSLDLVKKNDAPTVLAFGSIRPMKRTHHIVRAFEILKINSPQAKLVIAGNVSGKYGQKVLKMIHDSPAKSSIEYLGSVDTEKKKLLMQQAHLIAVTSIKEGWGLIVTEANSQGTPAVVYDIDGLRDSVKNGETGIVTKMNSPQELALQMTELLHNSKEYSKFQQAAWEWSKSITFDNSYKDFLKEISHV